MLSWNPNYLFAFEILKKKCFFFFSYCFILNDRFFLIYFSKSFSYENSFFLRNISELRLYVRWPGLLQRWIEAILITAHTECRLKKNKGLHQAKATEKKGLHFTFGFQIILFCACKKNAAGCKKNGKRRQDKIKTIAQ